jgi:hypothetical protein
MVMGLPGGSGCGLKALMGLPGGSGCGLKAWAMPEASPKATSAAPADRTALRASFHGVGAVIVFRSVVGPGGRHVKVVRDD